MSEITKTGPGGKIGDEGVNPWASDAEWISDGGYDEAAQEDIDSVNTDESGEGESEEDGQA